MGNKGTAMKDRPAVFRCGDRVRIKPYQAIAAILDAEGSCDGLPFMPEMQQWCGQEVTLRQPVYRLLVEGTGIRGMRDTVMLDDFRCDGTAHGGCQRACRLLWKTAWLQSADTDVDEPRRDCTAIPPTTSKCQGQGAALIAATFPLPGWDWRQYRQDLATGLYSPTSLLAMLGVSLGSRLWWGVRKLLRCQRRTNSIPPASPLLLQAGDWVEVRSAAEIAATLDSRDMLQGLLFAELMKPFCGQRFRVLQRAERFVVEETGRLQRGSHTVLLEGVTCNGMAFRGCPRDCYWFWKEAWLRRVTATSPEAATEQTLPHKEIHA